MDCVAGGSGGGTRMDAEGAKSSCDTNLQVDSCVVRTSDGSSSCSNTLPIGSFSESGLRENFSPVIGGEKPERVVKDVDPMEDRELRSVFDSVDEDNDGRITKTELASFMKKLNLASSTDQIQCILESADENGDGVLEYEEFVKLYHSLKTLDCEGTNGGEDGDGLLEAFNVFDSNSDGFISPSELQTVVQCFRLGKTVEDCTHMIKAVDKDGDGLVNFQEFKEMMLSSLQP